MSSLGDVLGAIMADLTTARRIADEQSVRIAEFYRSEPLLEGVSIPRVRLPEVTIDLPVLIEDGATGTPDEPQTPEKLAASITEAAFKAGDAAGESLPANRRDELRRIIEAKLKERASGHDAVARADFRTFSDPGSRADALRRANLPRRPVSMREVARRGGRESFTEFLTASRLTLKPETAAAINNAIDEAANRDAVARPGVAPSVAVNVLTSAVKDSADPKSVGRIRVVLKEEGLEWSAVDDESGGTRRVLSPE
jgi:hypothetical protein